MTHSTPTSAVTLQLAHSPDLTVRSHGWAHLAPFHLLAPDTLVWAARLPQTGPAAVTITWDADRHVRASVQHPDLPDADLAFLRSRVAWMFRSGEDFAPFWERCRKRMGWGHVAEMRAGALLRSGALFEDVVKTLCTVNCTWANTTSMVANLCARFGERVPGDGLPLFTFPDPATLAAAPEGDLRTARLGFRAPWVHALAQQVGRGELDLDAWTQVRSTRLLRERISDSRAWGPMPPITS